MRRFPTRTAASPKNDLSSIYTRINSIGEKFAFAGLILVIGYITLASVLIYVRVDEQYNVDILRKRVNSLIDGTTATDGAMGPPGFNGKIGQIGPESICNTTACIEGIQGLQGHNGTDGIDLTLLSSVVTISEGPIGQYIDPSADEIILDPPSTSLPLYPDVLRDADKDLNNAFQLELNNTYDGQKISIHATARAVSGRVIIPVSVEESAVTGSNWTNTVHRYWFLRQGKRDLTLIRESTGNRARWREVEGHAERWTRNELIPPTGLVAGRILSISDDGNVIASSVYPADIQIFRRVEGDDIWTADSSDFFILSELPGIDRADTARLSGDGNTFVIGDILQSGQAGKVGIWHYAAGTWTQETVQGPVCTACRFGFDATLSYDGNVAYVGANLYSNPLGGVYTMTRNGTTWTLVTDSVVLSPGGTIDFGTSIDCSSDGKRVVIGSSNEVFVYDNPTLSINSSLFTTAALPVYALVGKAVSINGDDGSTIIAGAPQYDLGNSTTGAYVHYELIDGTWRDMGIINPSPHPQALDNLGEQYTIAVSTDGFTATLGNKEFFWTFRRGAKGQTFTQAISIASGGSTSVSGDGTIIATGGDDQTFIYTVDRKTSDIALEHGGRLEVPVSIGRTLFDPLPSLNGSSNVASFDAVTEAWYERRGDVIFVAWRGTITLDSVVNGTKTHFYWTPPINQYTEDAIVGGTVRVTDGTDVDIGPISDWSTQNSNKVGCKWYVLHTQSTSVVVEVIASFFVN